MSSNATITQSNLSRHIRYGWPFLLGFLWTLYMFWPGILTHDLLFTYGELKMGVLTNGHPPFMLMLMCFCNRLWHGCGLYFALQSSILWYGLYQLAVALAECGIKARVFLVILGFSPLVMEVGARVTSDALFLGFLILGAALALRVWISAEIDARSCFWAFVALLAAYLSREYNAGPSVLPFVLILAFRLVSRPLFRTLAVAAMLVVFLLSAVAERDVMNLAMIARQWGGQSYGYATYFDSHPQNAVVIYDLAGITLESGHDVFPDYIRKDPAHSMDNLKKAYLPFDCGPLFWDWSGLGFPPGCGAIVGTRNLMSTWFSAIRQEPLAYLRHRVNVNRHFLMIACVNETTHTNLDPFASDPNLQLSMPGEPRDNWILQTHLFLAFYQGFTQRINHYLPIFKPYVWGLLGLFFLYWAWALPAHTKATRFAVAMTISGIAQIFLLFVIGSADYYRYYHWTVVAVAIAAYIFLASAVLKRDLRPRPLGTSIFASVVLILIFVCEHLVPTQ